MTRTLAQPATRTPGRYSAAEVAAMIRKPVGRVRGVASREDRTFMGAVFDSKAEANYAADLHAQAICGQIHFWWRQVKFPGII